MADSTDIFGPLVSPWDVAQAVLSTVEAWLPSYAAELQGRLNLRPPLPPPPSPESFLVGLDFLGFMQDQTPAIIAVCEPLGAPERTGNGDHNQSYQIRLGCVIIDGGESEQAAIRNASLYGALLAMIITQQGALKGAGTTIFAQRTTLEGGPTVEFQDEAIRNRVQSVVTFHSSITRVLNEDGPEALPVPPGTAVGPAVTKTNVTVTALPLS